MPIKEKIEQLKNFLTGHINSDMDAETLKAFQDQIQVCDDALVEDKAVQDEILDYKNTIIKMVKSSGSSEQPREITDTETQPRTLEEIALDYKNKKGK